MRLLFPRLLAVVAALGIAAAVGTAHAAPIDEPDAPFVPGQVIVGLEPGASPQDIGVQPALELRSVPDAVTVSVPAGREQQYIDTFSKLDGVRYVELNYLAQPQILPNDPSFPQQWDMPVVQAPHAWDLTRGAGVTVAIVDTGVAFEDNGDYARSPELSETTFVDPWDFTQNDPHPNDDQGHGTHVTGTVAQDWNDGNGVAGIAPEAKIMPVKVCLSTGCPGDLMAEGIRWAVDHGADVINMSLGGPTLPSVEREALAYAEENGVVVVAASGNQGASALNYPARIDTVIAVGSTDLRNDRNGYSNYGEHEDEGGILIMAPGGNTHEDLDNDGNPDGILQSTYAFTCGQGEKSYQVFADCYYQGTSMATPHITATVALIKSLYPSLTPAQVRDVLACAAKDIGLAGVDSQSGVGLVQIYDSIRDNNQNGVPDCLDTRPQFTVGIGSGSVEPGLTITVPVFASTDTAIEGYRVLIRSTTALTPFKCKVRGGATCVIDINGVNIDSQGEVLRGDFQIGTITFGSTRKDDVPLKVSASATLVDEFQPPIEVITQNGEINIEDVPQTVTGDVNCDGNVSASDVTQSLGYALGVAQAFCWRYGDINCTGEIDAVDALSVLDFISGLETSLPSGCPNDGG